MKKNTNLTSTTYLRIVFVILVLVCSFRINGQQLQYQTFAVGNTHVGKPGGHMQNHASDMDVLADGTCQFTSVWDEGGQPAGNYKDGVNVGNNDYTANSK